MLKKRLQLIITAVLFLSYCILILLANILGSLSAVTGKEIFLNIGGLIFVIIAIPVFSIILPVIFAKKWKLNFSFLPKTPRKILLSIILFFALLFFSSINGIKLFLNSGLNIQQFIFHLISMSLFHLTYYPLFVVLIFPVIRKNFNILTALIVTSLLFALYHFAQFFFFPPGLTLLVQIKLFASFFIFLIFYLYSESIVITSFLHILVGGMNFVSSGGDISTEVDFVSITAIVFFIGIYSFMIIYELINKKKDFRPDWWLNFKFKESADENS